MVNTWETKTKVVIQSSNLSHAEIEIIHDSILSRRRISNLQNSYTDNGTTLIKLPKQKRVKGTYSRPKNIRTRNRNKGGKYKNSWYRPSFFLPLFLTRNPIVTMMISLQYFCGKQWTWTFSRFRTLRTVVHGSPEADLGDTTNFKVACVTVNESMKNSALWGPKMTNEDDSVGDKSCVLLTFDTAFDVLNSTSLEGLWHGFCYWACEIWTDRHRFFVGWCVIISLHKRPRVPSCGILKILPFLACDDQALKILLCCPEF